MIDFVGTSPSLRKALLAAMATMHFHIAQTGLFMGFFLDSRGPRKQFSTNSKWSLGCKVGQIRSRGSRFVAEISLSIMLVYVFTLFIRLLLIFFEYANKLISYSTTR